MTNSVEEIKDNEVIFIIGSNTTENHPVIGALMKQAKRKGAKIIVADPRRIEMAEYSDVYLHLKPGTNIALLNGIMHVIIRDGLQDKEYIEERTENYEELERLVESYTPERVAEICGVRAEDIEKAAHIYAKANNAGIYYAMGVTQHTSGTAGVMTVSNLALLCGNVGKENAGVNPLRGQNNVQGACDMGGLPGDFPGYQKVHKLEVIDKFSDAWESKLSPKVGLTISEMFDAIDDDIVKFLYVMGENPIISDPDSNHVKHVLEKVDFLVVQDIFMSETAELADVVLPAAAFAEKDGTYTNTDRRVQRIRKAVDTPGVAKADWVIIMELMNIMGDKTVYSHPSEIMDEVAVLTPTYAGISYERLENGGLQWPVPNKTHPGTKYLHKTAIARGRGLFMPSEHIESAEVPDREYPYILTTGRILYQYHTMTMTGREEGLMQLAPESFVEINDSTANKLGIEDGDMVKLTSRRGETQARARVTDGIGEEVVFMPFHYAEGKANLLTNPATDEYAKIPELKVSAVKVEKV